MTDRLWEYLEIELDKPCSYIVIDTEYGTFVVEPIFSTDGRIIDFSVQHGSYYTTVRGEPDIWFWEEIEKALLK